MFQVQLIANTFFFNEGLFFKWTLLKLGILSKGG